MQTWLFESFISINIFIGSSFDVIYFLFIVMNIIEMIVVPVVWVLRAYQVDEIQYDAEINIIFAVEQNNVGIP